MVMCPLCKGEMIRDTANLPYEIGKDRLVVIKDVPATLCRQCGEFFIEIAEARVVEKIVEAVDRDGLTLGFVEYRKAA